MKGDEEFKFLKNDYNSDGFFCSCGRPTKGILTEDHLTEGLLCDGKRFSDIKLLFVLREPNSGGRRADTFWIKDIIAKAERGEALSADESRYYKWIKNITDLFDIADLSDCAYINLFPFRGKGSAGDDYKRTLRAFKGKNTFKREKIQADFSKLAENRWEIIKRLSDKAIVITLGDIYDGIAAKERNGITENTEQHLILGKKKFKSCIIKTENKSIRILSCYHPAAIVSFDGLKKV